MHVHEAFILFFDFTLNSNAWFFLVAVGLVCLVVWMNKHTEKRTVPSRAECRIFYPFLSDNLGTLVNKNSDQHQYLIPRTAESERIYSLLVKQKNKHFVCIGDSGAGKSLLFKNDILKNENVKYCVFTDEYETHEFFIILSQISKLKPNGDTAESLIKKLRMENDVANFEQLIKEILVETIPTDSDVILVFDQAERLVSQIDKQQTQYEQKLYSLYEILIRALRNHNNVRTVFLVRSDLSTQLLQLIQRIECKRNRISFSDTIHIYMFDGFNIEDDRQFNLIISKFDEIGFSGDPEKLINSISADGSTINSFELQFIGFMIEHYKDYDDTIKNQILIGEIKLLSLIRRFWYYLSSEFTRLNNGGTEGGKNLFIVAYTISVLNKERGAPVSSDEVAKLSALSKIEVSAAIDFLANKSIITSNKHNKYRLIHDMVRDFFIGEPNPEIRTAYREAITSQLIEVTDENLDKCIPPSRSYFISDLFDPRGSWNLSLLIIFGMMVLCIARLISPEYLYAIVEANYPSILDLTFISGPKDYPVLAYFPNVVAQFLWVTFMYDFNRNYFRQFLPSNAYFSRICAEWAAPLGAILGGLTIFAPSLFIIPIFTGGSLLSICYLYSFYRFQVSGRTRVLFKELGLKTVSNMLLSAIITWILYTLFLADGMNWNSQVIAFLTSLGFIYFYFMMKDRQCSPSGWGELVISSRIDV